jgi:hypothetical protein
MPFAVIHTFKGSDPEQYARAQAVVHPADGSLPDGQLVHFGGMSGDDLIVVAVFDSQELWQAFRDETLLPGLRGGEGMPENPPQELTFQTLKFQTA